jgi:hypothetical protein
MGGTQTGGSPLGLAGFKEAELRMYRAAKADPTIMRLEEYAGVVTVAPGRIADVGVFYRFRESVKAPPTERPDDKPKVKPLKRRTLPGA